MALVAGVFEGAFPEESFDATPAAARAPRTTELFADDDEAPPITSRSPSFIRVRSAESRADESDEYVVVADATRHHDTIAAPPPLVSVEDVARELESDFRIRALRLEEAAQWDMDARRGARLRAFSADAAKIADCLCALTSPDAELTAIVRHVYEWAGNIVDRTAGLQPPPSDGGELTAVDYSSLFVRKIIDPMIEAAVELFARRGNEKTLARLRTLRESVIFLNWSLRALTE